MADNDRQNDKPSVAEQPGAVITPGSDQAGLDHPVQPEGNQPPTVASQPNPQPESPSIDDNEPPLDSEEAYKYMLPNSSPDASLSQTVTWTASEFVAHDKAFSWYLGLGVAALIFAAIVYWLTRDVISSIVIVVAGVIFGIYASNKPRQLEYSLDRTGLRIGNKLYSYGDFKSFSLRQEGQLTEITLMPLKRFMPPLTVFYDSKDEDAIMNVLTAYLPYEEPKRDTVDSLMRRIRF